MHDAMPGKVEKNWEAQSKAWNPCPSVPVPWLLGELCVGLGDGGLLGGLRGLAGGANFGVGAFWCLVFLLSFPPGLLL